MFWLIYFELFAKVNNFYFLQLACYRQRLCFKFDQLNYEIKIKMITYSLAGI